MTLVACGRYVEVLIQVAVVAVQLLMSQFQDQARRFMVELAQYEILVTVGTGPVQSLDGFPWIMASCTFLTGMKIFQMESSQVMRESRGGLLTVTARTGFLIFRIMAGIAGCVVIRQHAQDLLRHVRSAVTARAGFVPVTGGTVEAEQFHMLIMPEKNLWFRRVGRLKEDPGRILRSLPLQLHGPLRDGFG